ncbi:MAG: capsule biosynthesis protein capC [Actinobacteria bacterium]|nr:MAG: capsule biosynthesis protein capC [Actinomycetota bacterium]
MLDVPLSAPTAMVGLAVGIVCALLLHLRTRLSPGGLLTPGWFAVAAVTDPRAALVILAASVLTYLGVLAGQRYLILYGDRLFAAALLLGVVLVAGWYLLPGVGFPAVFSVAAFGLIVPGWLAYQLASQPVLPTVVVTGVATGASYLAVVGALALG